jgi:O-antigen/teichoic acid export membrane protein
MWKKLASPAWAMLEYGSYPLLLFIATPWFLHQLGTGGYGHWMLLTATVGFGGVLNAGTGAATIKAVSAGIGRSKDRDVEHTVKVSLAIAILGGGALASLVFSVFSIAGPTLLSRMGDPALIRLTGVAAAALIWLEQLDNVFSSAIKGAEQFGQAARIEIASKTTQIIAAGIILWMWPALWALYAALLVVAVLRLIAKTIIARRLLGLTNLRPTLIGANTILNFAKWGWLQGVGGMLFGVADRMLVGSLLGASSLTYYSIASQLAMQIHAVSAAGLSVIFPKVSRKLESSGHFSLWRVTKLTMAGNLLLSSLLALVLLLLGPTILRSWIGAASAAPTAQILPWLALAYWVLALNVVPYYILLGMGRMRFVGLTVLSCGIIAVTTMYFAITHEGLRGAPAGRGIYALLSFALIFPLIRHFTQERRIRHASQRISLASNRGPLP